MADEKNKVAEGNSAESAASKSVKKKTVKKAAKKAVKKKTVKKTAKKAATKKSVKAAKPANGNGQKEKAKIRLKDQATPQTTTASKVKVAPKAEKDRLGLLSTLSIFMLLIIGVWAIYSYMNEQETATVEEIKAEVVVSPAAAPVAAPAPEVLVVEEVIVAPVEEVSAPDTEKETAPVAEAEVADEAVEATDAADQKDESKGFFENIFGRKDEPSTAEGSNDAAATAAETTQPAADPMAMQDDPFGPPPGFYDNTPPQGFGPPPGFYDDMPPQDFGPPQGYGPPPGFYDMPPMPEYDQGRGW